MATNPNVISTGGFPRSINRSINLDDFGAAGDGVTDDTVALTTALDAAAPLGLPIKLTNGKIYLLDSWTKKTTQIALKIIGNGAVLKGPPITVALFSPKADIDFQDVVFDRWQNVLTRTAAEGGSVGTLNLKSCTFKNCAGFTINIETAVDYLIENCTFDSNRGGWNIRIGRNIYAEQDFWSGKLIANIFTNGSASGSKACGGAILYGQNTFVSMNVVDGMNADAGPCYGIYSKLRNSVVDFNIVKNINTVSGPEVVGINGKGGEPGTISGPGGYDTKFYGNKVSNIGVAGVKGSGIRLQTSRQSAFYNTIRNFGMNGLLVDESSADIDDIGIIGNRIYGTDTARERGVNIATRGTRVIVEQNLVHGCTTGFRVASIPSQTLTAPQIRYNWVVMSVAAGNKFPIYIRSSGDITRMVIADNIFKGLSSHGIYFEGTENNRSGLLFANNDLSDATTKVRNFPVDAIIEGNIGFITSRPR